MEKPTSTPASLNKAHITTEDIIDYLQSINDQNDEIIKILTKAPALPEYEQLDWFIESKQDKAITQKLIQDDKLTLAEKNRLLDILRKALVSITKSHPFEKKTIKSVGLQKYISQFI